MRRKAAANQVPRALPGDAVRARRGAGGAASGNTTGRGFTTLRGGQYEVAVGDGLDYGAHGEIVLRAPRAPLALAPGSPRRFELQLDEGLEVSARGKLAPSTSSSVRVVGGALIATPSTLQVTDPTDGTAAAALGRVAGELVSLDTRIDALEAAPSGAASGATATVDFGAFDTTTTVVVTGLAWVTLTSRIVATVASRMEDALLDGVLLAVGDLVAGDGFTVYAHAPEGSTGTFDINLVGV